MNQQEADAIKLEIRENSFAIADCDYKDIDNYINSLVIDCPCHYDGEHLLIDKDCPIHIMPEDAYIALNSKNETDNEITLRVILPTG